MTYEKIERHMGDIEVTCYDSDTFRIARLHQALGYAAAMMDVNDAGYLAHRVSGVHDHKGCLQVHWLSMPDQLQRHVFHLAWNSQVGDGSDLVEQFLQDKQIF